MGAEPTLNSMCELVNVHERQNMMQSSMVYAGDEKDRELC